MVRRSALAQTRQAVQREAYAVAGALRLAVDRRMAGLGGLASFVEVSWGRPTFEVDFERYAAVLVDGTTGIRTVQWVRDGVVRQTVPLSGNEAAIGLNLRDQQDPRLAEAFARAEQSSDIILTEPRELVQGGKGLIGRLAARASDGTLLAVVAVVLDLPPLLFEGGLDSARLQHRVAVYDTTGPMLFGERPDPAEQPVELAVTVPGGAWRVAVIPRDGWASSGAAGVATFRVRGAVVVLLLAGLTRAWSVRQREGRRLREAEAARQAEERFTRLFHLHPDGVVLTRLSDGALLEANDALEAMSGYTRTELLGRTTLELSFWARPEDRAYMLSLVQQNGVCRNVPMKFRRKNGALVETLVSARTIDLDGVPCLLSIVRDVTEQRELERQLATAQRLDAIGRLAGGMAHDFNNLLTGITGYADLLLAREPNLDARDDLEQIVRTADRGAELTRKLLAFARHQVQVPRVLDLNTVVADAGNLLRRLIGEHITLELVAAPDLGHVRVDAGAVEQILVNLAVNGRDAMPSGGTLRIGTRNEADDVLLEVRDTGAGIAPEHLEHIFEPFFTTKGSGRGTGLGLAMCYGLVHQAGGRIEVESTLGQGTTMRVRLPRVEAPVEPAKRGAVPASPMPRGTETVLVAEDEPTVRELIHRTLSGLGYTVLAAADGAEAVHVAAHFALPIQLLLTDVVMPTMGGEELAARLKAERHDLRVVFMSGYTSDAAALQAAVAAGDSFVAKPFTPRELARQVRAALDRPRA